MAHDLAFDPKYEIEDFLKEHAHKEDKIEVYGPNLFLPRFSNQQKVIRVASGSDQIKSLLYGLTEKNDLYSNLPARDPSFIVVNENWAFYRYLDLEDSTQKGKRLPPNILFSRSHSDGSSYFRHLYAGELFYQPVFFATCKPTSWLPHFYFHGSLCTDLRVFKKR